MKTQIFHLGDYDDILSARDQIGWSKASRVVIVFPEKKGVSFALTDYVLLAREANRIGASAAFVLRDKKLRSQLNEMGLLCFRSIREANQSRWRTGKRMKRLDTDALPFRRVNKEELRKTQSESRAVRKIPPGIRVVFFALAVTAVICMAMLFVPTARVTLTPDRQEQQFAFVLHGDKMRETTPYSGIVHIEPFEFTLEDEIWIPASDQINLAKDHATGSIEVFNLTNQSLSIPAGLVVLAEMEEPVRFETSRAATIMAGYGSSEILPIKAILPGESGNVPAGVITILEGNWAFSAQVTNPLPTGGGTSITVSSPTETDQKRARNMLLDQLDETAKARTGEFIQPGQVLVEDSLERLEILREQFEPGIGQPCEEMHLRMAVKYTGWYMLQDDLIGISGTILDALLPAGYTSVGGSILFDFSQPVIRNENGFDQKVEIFRTIEGMITPEDVFSLITGLTRDRASEILKERIYLAGEPGIQVSPDWWPILPFFRYQYEIIGK